MSLFFFYHRKFNAFCLRHPFLNETQVIYLDIPKNELQYRSRAGQVTNLGLATRSDPKQAYKRFYFVDWIVLNKHKSELIAQIDIIVDSQNPANPSFMLGHTFRASLDNLSKSISRVRPWFEPGAWGPSRNQNEPQSPRIENFAQYVEITSYPQHSALEPLLTEHKH